MPDSPETHSSAVRRARREVLCTAFAAEDARGQAASQLRPPSPMAAHARPSAVRVQNCPIWSTRPFGRQVPRRVQIGGSSALSKAECSWQNVVAWLGYSKAADVADGPSWSAVIERLQDAGLTARTRWPDCPEAQGSRPVLSVPHRMLVRMNTTDLLIIATAAGPVVGALGGFGETHLTCGDPDLPE